jgi:hypothetical protein
MRVVAVAASNTIRIHFALKERAPVVNLAALLAVRTNGSEGQVFTGSLGDFDVRNRNFGR